MLPHEVTGQIWLETTSLVHGHGGSMFWAFGKALWSPSRSKDGKDIYALMREVKTGDLVLHVLKGEGGQLVGYSRAAGACEEINEPPPMPGDWANMSPYYRIAIGDYTEIEPPVSIRALLHDRKSEFEAILNSGEPHLFFNPYRNELRISQGKYLTRVPASLYKLLSTVTLDLVELQRPVADKEYAEGANHTYIQTRQERDPRVRCDAIAKYGRRCMVCGFEFDNFYGPEVALGYIEIHHTKPLSEESGVRSTSLEDVIVTCSNCHRVIHRKRGETLKWQHLKSLISAIRKRKTK